MLSRFSCVQFFATPWTVGYQGSLSMAFSRQEKWSGLPHPPPRNRSNSGIKPESLMSPALAQWVLLPLVSPGKPINGSVQFSSVTQSCPTLRPNRLQHPRPPCPSPTPGVYSDSCSLSRWWHTTISSSVIPFSSHLQSFPASGSFPMSQFFTSVGQSIEVSASAWVLPMNIQDWFPLGWTVWISLQSKGLSRVFSNTTVQEHQFFGAQLSYIPYWFCFSREL